MNRPGSELFFAERSVGNCALHVPTQRAFAFHCGLIGLPTMLIT